LFEEQAEMLAEVTITLIRSLIAGNQVVVSIPYAF